MNLIFFTSFCDLIHCIKYRLFIKFIIIDEFIFFWKSQTHPFGEGAKLQILNGNFSLPTHDGRYDDFHDLIRGMLKVIIV